MENINSLLSETGEIKIGSFSAPIQSPSVLLEEDRDTNNSFKLKYKLYGVDNSEIITEIITGNVRDADINTIITPKLYGNSIHNTEVEFKYNNQTDIYTEIQTGQKSDYNTEIFINPSNRMWALYEVKQPPIITDVFNPIQDSFTRSQTSFQTINYGDSLSMIAGKTDSDLSRSFVQFDVSSINQSFVLTESYMRLYYRGSAPNGLEFEVLTVSEAWSEYGITDLNRPSPRKVVSSEYKTNLELGYVEFNVSDIVKDWVGNKVVNDGLVIRLSNETTLGQTIFNTRESSRPPELIVNYYDSTIFSTGRAQIVTEIYAIQKEDSEVDTEITVRAVHDFSDYNTEIRIHDKNIPFDDDWDFEITATKEKIFTEITASILDGEEKLTIIDVRTEYEEKKLISIGASREIVLTEVTSAITINSEYNTEISISNETIDTEVTVRITDLSECETVITVSEKTLNDHNTEIVVKGDNYFDKGTEVSASNPSVAMEVAARIEGKSIPYTVIDISKPNVETIITVKYREDYDTEIVANKVSKVDFEVTSSKPSITMEVTARTSDDSDFLTQIDVREESDYDTEITSKVFSQHDTEITITLKSQQETEITSSRPITNLEIMVPYYGREDAETEISPRIRLVDNINTVIQIGKKKGSYVFMI